MHPVGTLTVDDRQYVVIPVEEYRRLSNAALPDLPAADQTGHFPAMETGSAMLARKLIQRRISAGMEQQELARRAGVRPETISRIEAGKFRPRAETMARIERALARAGRRRT